MILCPLPRGGKLRFKGIKNRYQKFLSYQWLKKPPAKPHVSVDDVDGAEPVRVLAALASSPHLINLKAAVLAWSWLAPMSEDTTSKLAASTHPDSGKKMVHVMYLQKLLAWLKSTCSTPYVMWQEAPVQVPQVGGMRTSESWLTAGVIRCLFIESAQQLPMGHYLSLSCYWHLYW